MSQFPFFRQQDQSDCGPTCLKMIAAYYGKSLDIKKLRKLCYINRKGVNLLALSEAADEIGFQTIGARVNVDKLTGAELPCILHWRQNHYIILHKIHKNKFYLADPGSGLIKMEYSVFMENWLGHLQSENGVTLFMSPTSRFYENAEAESEEKLSWKGITKYFSLYRSLFFQLIIGLAFGTILTIAAPFLTQLVVDVGINTHDISFVYLLLIAQIMLFIGSTSVNFIRSWILLHISTRINLSILTDFLIKLMKLPISFFESKTTGDIMQRMNDHQKIEAFLSGTTLTTIFSIINLLTFTIILFHYSPIIFAVTLICNIFYGAWLFLFLDKRRKLNYKQFDNSSFNQTTIVELVNGIQEIKLNNCEQRKRWSWEKIQVDLFKYKVQNLALNQYQQGGSLFISQAKNILITFLSIKAVIGGQLTLGGMMAIQYISGQIASPMEQMLSFIQNYQDAKISLERLNAIHVANDEQDSSRSLLTVFPLDKSIHFKNITFQYPGAGNEPVLQNLTFKIPAEKTTAIVGMSGNGKTTLLKLLLRFHEPDKGKIIVGGTDISEIDFATWRSGCGTVLQDGFVFSDTILGNISISSDYPDLDRVDHALKTANLTDFITGLPFGLQTQIGSSGHGLSQGQKQRLLIARAIYKNPHYLFFDEATNALDAKNELIIMSNFKTFLKGRTVVVVAHRLSTIKSADNIIVMGNGKIAEQGTHNELINLKGEYYELIKNQLALEI